MPRRKRGEPLNIQSMAREHSAAAIKTLNSIATSTKVPPAARVSAATALLDRGWGKPSQTVEGNADNPVQIVVSTGIVRS